MRPAVDWRNRIVLHRSRVEQVEDEEEVGDGNFPVSHRKMMLDDSSRSDDKTFDLKSSKRNFLRSVRRRCSAASNIVGFNLAENSLFLFFSPSNVETSDEKNEC